MPAAVPLRLPRRTFLDAEYAGLENFPAGGLPAEVSLAPAYPGYVLVRRDYVRHIPAHHTDNCRKPFIIQYDIRRLRRERKARNRFDGRRLRPTPKYNRKGRWQLDVVLTVGGKKKRTGCHRLIGLSVCPCTTDSRGFEVDPYKVSLGRLTRGLYDIFWEVHHGDQDTRNNTAGNLFTLW